MASRIQLVGGTTLVVTEDSKDLVGYLNDGWFEAHQDGEKIRVNGAQVLSVEDVGENEGPSLDGG